MQLLSKQPSARGGHASLPSSLIAQQLIIPAACLV